MLQFLCVCAGATAPYKALSIDGIPLSVVVAHQIFPASLMLQTRYRQLAVVVDVSCVESVIFVVQVRYCIRAASNVVDSS